MADTRTKNQTHAAPQQMREAGMPQGQAPAVQRPMTAVERRNAEQARKAGPMRAQLLEAVEAQRLNIEAFLGAFEISYDIFLAGLLVFLSRQQRDTPDFFDNLDVASFIEALTRIAMNGLIPDGKEAAIAAYKDNDKGGIKVAQAMFMRDGFVKVLWRTGMVKAINDQVVTEAEYAAGRFDYEEGDQGYITHKVDLMRKDVDPVVAAYCIIELVGGGVMREVVPKDELEKMARMSRSPARKSWAHQMNRKGALRRIMGKMPREKGIVQLLQHDDETYRQIGAGESSDTGAPDRASLFSNKPIRRKRQPLPVKDGKIVAQEGGLQVQEGDQLHATMDEDGAILSAEIVGEQVGIAGEDLKEGDVVQVQVFPPDKDQLILKVEEEGGGDQPFVLQAILSRKNGLQQFPADQAELWFGDIQQKMKALEGDQLGAFWRINRGYVEEAGRNGYGGFAMKLVALATECGLISRGS